MSKENVFGFFVRCVFLFAFGAFLYASINHIATFFSNFEPFGTDYASSYALAISVDGTALVLTTGMMFFSKNMPWYAKTFVWLFIIGLTAFSWVVNWEYATTYQSETITSHLNPIWRSINPILASSFAFLNLAYTIVSDFFNAREETLEELQKELTLYTGERAELARQILAAKNSQPSLVERTKNKILEAKLAAKEVMKNDEIVLSAVLSSEQSNEQFTVSNRSLIEHKNDDSSEQLENDLANEKANESEDLLFTLQNELANSPANERENIFKDLLFSGENELQNELANTGENNLDDLLFSPANELANDFSTFQRTQKPRITVPLTEQKRSLRNTDELAKKNKNVHKERTVLDGDEAKKIVRILKKNPEIGPTELAQKAGVSKSYASTVKVKYVSSLQQ